MNRKVGIRWHLREPMAAKGMFMNSDLVPKLAERGIELSGLKLLDEDLFLGGLTSIPYEASHKTTRTET